METALNRMQHSLSDIKNWEEMLNNLKKSLNDIGLSSEQLDLKAKLIHVVQQIVDQLEPLIYRVGQTSSQNQAEESADATNLNDDDHRRAVISQEWVDLGLEEKIFGSNTFNCLRTLQFKICALCLPVFPDNAVIKKRPLIYWWMGEGLVAKAGQSTAEQVGEQMFQELLHEGFIKSTTTASTKNFTVNPSIRLMLIQLATKSGLLDFTSDGTPCDSRQRTFLRRENSGENGNEGERENVRTVFNINAQYLGQRMEWLRRLTNVEVLQMGRWQESAAHHIEVEDYKELLFNGLGSQKHLKYLSLRGISRIESLPPSIAKLVSLQILDLKACHNLEKLPDSIAELKKLTHLDVSECYLLDTIPKGLEHLSNLQVVKGFVVGSPARNACKLSDMARLRQLRKLSLRVLRHDSDQMETLKNFEVLKILSISWSEAVAGELSLPDGLTKLDLRCLPFETVPDWMKASEVPKNLNKMYITGGKLKSINIQDYENQGVEVRLKYLQLE